MAKLKPDEIKQLANVISEEIEQISEESEIRETIQILPETFWLKLKEEVRIRTEHILAKSIESGQYDESNRRCKSGALGTWAVALLENFLSKNSVLISLLGKLDSDDILQQDYVFNYFFGTIFKLLKDDDFLDGYACSIILVGLNNGDIRFYNAIKSIMSSEDNPFKEKFQNDFDNFQEKEDDVPF